MTHTSARLSTDISLRSTRGLPASFLSGRDAIQPLTVLGSLAGMLILICSPLLAQSGYEMPQPDVNAVPPVALQQGVPSAMPPAMPPVMPPVTAQEQQDTSAPATPEPPPAAIYTPNQVQGGQTATQNPVDGVMLRNQQVTTLNTNASTIQYSDRHIGPFTLQSEVSGAFTSNLYSAFKNTQGPRSGFFLDFALPVGLQVSRPETNFNLYFRNSYSYFPDHSDLNGSSQVFAAEYVHNTSERTIWDFSLAGGRIRASAGYLPAVVTIGSTGIFQSNTSLGAMSIYNSASTFAMSHRFSSRDTVVASLTTAFMQQSHLWIDGSVKPTLDRYQTAGFNMRWQRAVHPRQAVGIEVTDVYVRGLSPRGKSEFAAVEATYRQALPRRWSLQMAAGPLYDQTQVAGTATTNGISYLASASLDYQATYGHVSGGYARVLQLANLAAPAAAHELFLLFDRPISRKLDVIVNARDIRAPGTGKNGDYSSFGLTGRLNEHITPNLVFFIGGALLPDSQPDSNLNRRDALAGFIYNFGNPLARTGVR